MKILNLVSFVTCLAFAALLLALTDTGTRSPERLPQPFSGAADSADVAEARIRCRLLHETIHGSLQVMHRDFFRDGRPTGGNIPSKSLEDVFGELEKAWAVNVKWLAVDTEAMNPDHRPNTDFDQLAVKGIAEGLDRYEAADDKGVFHYAGRITLGNQCLKCHVPDRRSLEDRKAAIVISMPAKLREPEGK
jgi:hypothetical protein